MYRILKYAGIIAIAMLAACQKDKPFKLVLLPDTQFYSMEYPEVFQSQARWIAENADDITFVIHQGDITHNNNDIQWEAATEAINMFDKKVPFTFVPGNHDMGDRGSANVRNTDLLNYYLPYSKYSQAPTFGGAFESGKMDNTWHLFKAGNLDWLIISLEFGPRNKVLHWASGIAASHPDHKIIVNTHAYMYSDDNRMSELHNHKWLPQNYKLGKETGDNAVNNGEQMWETFIKHHPNIIFVFSGHVLNDGTGLLISEGTHGNKVYQMLANYQTGVVGAENGGNGFLRIITIDKSSASASVRTYSPFTNQHKTELDQEFILNGLKF